MQDTNIHNGVYEQIINRLFKLKLNEVDAGRFYIGKKLISKDDAVNILSKYLQHLIEVRFLGPPTIRMPTNILILLILSSRH
ncbi:hypothetical protein [uncultured Prevotella sp.]|uniref:hypothetical protein n=1 Tax=uncultured Prevotella sp. TaxID=159272 RepID=UPI0027E2BF46|nr:hypothetical protein [uncultured Prevotella sp.]